MNKLKIIIGICVLFPCILFARTGIDTDGTKTILTGNLDGGGNTISNASFVGNGAGLTNAPYGDVYLASNNVFGGTTTQSVGRVKILREDGGLENYWTMNNYQGHLFFCYEDALSDRRIDFSPTDRVMYVDQQTVLGTWFEGAVSYSEKLHVIGNAIIHGSATIHTNLTVSNILSAASLQTTGDVLIGTAVGVAAVLKVNGAIRAGGAADVDNYYCVIDNITQGGGDVDFTINTFSDATLKNMLYFDTSLGYVGIDTNVPSEKLTVNGNIKASGALSAASLQITGGATNGAILGSTNSTGQSAWVVLPKIHANKFAAQAFTNGVTTKITFEVNSNQYAGVWDGTYWTPGVGWITISSIITLYNGSLTGIMNMRLEKNGNEFLYGDRPYISAQVHARARGQWIFYNETATNRFGVAAYPYYGVTVTNVNDVGMTFFQGAVLP